MKFRKILRRTLWTIIILATVISLFYAEEDWRGARALRSAEEDYQRTGVSLNFSDYIPKAIPDPENLAALPIFAQAPDPKRGVIRPLRLEDAMRFQHNLEELPHLGNWQLGQSPDLKSIQFGVDLLFKATFKREPDSKSCLAQLETIYPVIALLNQASAMRPRCRFDFDYTNPLPLQRSFALMTDMIPLSKLLTLHGILALNENQPEVALEDIRTILLLRSSVVRDPSIIAHLIAIGMGAIGEAVLAEGLALHAWNDSQLVQLQDEMENVDYLAGYRFALQGELAAQMHDMPQVRDNLVRHFWFLHEDAENHQPVGITGFWPAGWVNGGAARSIRFKQESAKAVNLATHRVYPDWIGRLTKQRDHTFLHRRYILPWNFLFAEWSMGPDKILRNTAQAQAWVDCSVLACALERYHLANGRYADFLDALKPQFLSTIPHDPMNGEPYHYRLQADGSYLLYSVGWNETDDGGTVVLDKDDPQHQRIDYDQGDWVWFGPK